MMAPAPVHPAITTKIYDVNFSDADAFMWRPDLILPVQPDDDILESHVEFTTDEFGFRNEPPLPEKVDLVVLGRSTPLGANQPSSWPEMIGEQTGMQVLNLAQPGGNLRQKSRYLKRFGLPRNPKWVIVEVVPSIDIIGGQTLPLVLSKDLISPLFQSVYLQLSDKPVIYTEGAPLYPITIDLPDRAIDLTCCLHYLQFYTLEQSSLESSMDWINYRQELLNLISIAKSNSSCVVLMLSPTKPEAYFPLASNPDQLIPTAKSVKPLLQGSNGFVVPDQIDSTNINMVISNIDAGRKMVTDFANQQNIPLIDPTESFQEAILHGEDPFMVYDSHWNLTGHQIAAQIASKKLSKLSCP
jgi:hypothetical protein